MITAAVIWPPHPWMAGFCVSDDPDAATFEQTRAVYDYLVARSFVTTKAVWPFPPEEASGIPPTPESTLRGVTLADDRFRAYCRHLSEQGFEICLHGASAGNNRRERTLAAFAFADAEFAPSDTFICHSKNADNIYWESKTATRFPFGFFLRRWSRHASAGDEGTSPYFWGDVCRSRINQIRLYRTRCTNTLRRNPSMPWHDPRKPLVNGWFGATKRSLRDCANPAALARLKREHGLTVLYQYLHRYADAVTRELDRHFREAVDRISSDSGILVGTVSSMMRRLRQMQGVFTVAFDRGFLLLNASGDDIRDIQILSDRPAGITAQAGSILREGRTMIVPLLQAGSMLRVNADEAIRFSGRNAIASGHATHIMHPLPFGELRVNLSDGDWHTGDGMISAGGFRLDTLRAGTGGPLFSSIPRLEEARLVGDQSLLIARELLFKGRKLRTERYLDATKRIPLEDHDNW